MASALTGDQVKFIVAISQQTRIDPRVVYAWVRQENGSNFNYLGISPGGHLAKFNNVNDAINATMTVLREPRYATVLSTAQTKPSPVMQLHTIIASQWNPSHYQDPSTGQNRLINTFTSYFGNKGLTDSYVGPANAQGIATEAGTSAEEPSVGTDVKAAGQAASGLLSPFQDIASFFRWVGNNWDRILFVTGGMILIILAIVIFAKQQQKNMFTFSRGDE